MVEGEVGVRKGLSLNALRGVDYQHRALAGGKRAGDLVVEVNVTRGVDEVEHIFFAVIGGVVELHGVRLDGDASFTLKIHFIEQLRRHITQSDGFRLLQQAVGEGRFAVIDMSDYAKIPYLIF